MSYHFIQATINSGEVWLIPDAYLQRTAMLCIDEGYCMLGPKPALFPLERTILPSRTEVTPGTKGSREFVAKQRGEDHAQAMELAPNEVTPELLETALVAAMEEVFNPTRRRS